MSYQEKHSYLERADYTWSSDSVRFINTPTLSARQIYFYIQEAGYFRTSPPYFTERANLNSFLIIYTLSGEGQLRYCGNSYRLLPETTAFIHCMEHHFYNCLPNQDWEFLWFHFNGPSALGYFEEYAKNGFCILDGLDSFFMEQTMRQILSLTQKKELHSEIMVSSLITEILTQILIQSGSKNLKLGFMPSYLQDVLKEMDTRFQEPLTLDLLSRKFGISKYHLAREFKRYIGTPPNEFLTLIRINHAKELLKYSDLTVEEIACSCGFRHVSYFICLFKKYEKSTPLQYRKTWRSQ